MRQNDVEAWINMRQLLGSIGHLPVVGRRLPVIAEQVGAKRPRLPLATLGQQLIVWPLRHRTGRHSEEASHIGVLAAEGLPHCALGHIHGASVVH